MLKTGEGGGAAEQVVATLAIFLLCEEQENGIDNFMNFF